MTFTEAEETWLAGNPIIRLAVTDFIKPVDIVDAQGNYTGLNADLIALLSNKLGINIVPEFFSKWDDVVRTATSGQVDGAFSLSRTPEREKNILFTKPYAFDPIIVLVRKDERGIADWKDLSGKTVSVVKGASVIDDIEKVLGDGKMVEVENDAAGLKAWPGARPMPMSVGSSPTATLSGLVPCLGSGSPSSATPRAARCASAYIKASPSSTLSSARASTPSPVKSWPISGTVGYSPW